MTKRQTLENAAAIKLRLAAIATRAAMHALDDLRTDAAKRHAMNLSCALDAMEVLAAKYER